MRSRCAVATSATQENVEHHATAAFVNTGTVGATSASAASRDPTLQATAGFDPREQHAPLGAPAHDATASPRSDSARHSLISNAHCLSLHAHSKIEPPPQEAPAAAATTTPLAEPGDLPPLEASPVLHTTHAARRLNQHAVEDAEGSDEDVNAISPFSESWTKDLRRWCLATLKPNASGELAKIHIAMLRREFLLAAREKPYFTELSGPLSRPRSRESRTFLAALLAVVGSHAKQSQCVINGVNQIGIVGYTYKRPTAQDYARATKRDAFATSHTPCTEPHIANDRQFSHTSSNDPLGAVAAPAAAATSTTTEDDMSRPSVKPVNRTKRARTVCEQPTSASSSQSAGSGQKLTLPLTLTVEAPPPPKTQLANSSTSAAIQGQHSANLTPGISLSGQRDTGLTFGTPLTPEPGAMPDALPANCMTGVGRNDTLASDSSSPRLPHGDSSEEAAAQGGIGVLGDAPPVKLQFAVRMFKYGARHQLAVYSLASLRNPPDASEAVIPGADDLMSLLDWFRPGEWYVGGFDAVALGLLSLGPTSPPIPYALRTFTIVDAETVRISNAATDMRLPDHLDFDNILNVFDSQLVHLALKLMPSARYLAVDANRGSKNHAMYSGRGLPIINNENGTLRGTLFFSEWTPSTVYTKLFPHTSGVVHLRADVSPDFLPAVASQPNTQSAGYSDSNHGPVSSSAVSAQSSCTAPATSAASPITMTPILSLPLMPGGVQQPNGSVNFTNCTNIFAKGNANVYLQSGVSAANGFKDGHDAKRVRLIRSPPPDQPTKEQIAQWSTQIGIPSQHGDAIFAPTPVAVPYFQTVPRYNANATQSLLTSTQTGGKDTQQSVAPIAAYGAVTAAQQNMKSAHSLCGQFALETRNSVKGSRRNLSQAERAARDLKSAQRQLRQIRNHQKGVLSKKRPEAPPSWVEEVRTWARRVLKQESDGRIHVSKLRDEFLRCKTNEVNAKRIRSVEQSQADPAVRGDSISYAELKKLFALPKSHESRLFTITILSVVGVRSKRQQCVISGVNQCGIVGWKIDFADGEE